MKLLGPLQIKIIMLLKEDNLCGVEIMEKLNIRSPGTIYPVLNLLKKNELIDYRIEISKSIRKKIYSLTSKGREQMKYHLIQSVRNYCCFSPQYLKIILEKTKDIITISQNQRILCTIESEEIRNFFKGSEVVFSSDLNVPPNTFNVALGFLGVGCLLGNGTIDAVKYLTHLHKCLKNNGWLLAFEIEKTDNFFANSFFKDLLGLNEPIGMTRNELEETIVSIGFSEIKIISRFGIIYAVARKFSL